MKNDKKFMNRALFLAKKGKFTTDPNPNVGCVIVKKNKIISEGFHFQSGKEHAEILALRKASTKAKGSTVYVTLEPCIHYGKTPPCVDALISASVKRVVVAAKDPNPKVSGLGLYKLKNHGIEVKYGIFREKSKKLNQGFFKRMEKGIPYIRLKLASSLDGRIALRTGESKWITSIESRKDVQYFRAQSSAILTTSSTVLLDNPSLNVRWNNFSDKLKKNYNKKNIRQPVRIVLDRKSKIRPNHMITKLDGECWLIRSNISSEKWVGKVKEISFFQFKNKFNLVDLMKILAKNNINSLLVEAGSNFAGSLLRLNLVDELIIYLSPKILGKDSKELISIKGLKRILNAPNFKFTNIKFIKPDLRLTLIPYI